LTRGLNADLPQAIEPLTNSPVAMQSLGVINRRPRQSGKFLQYGTEIKVTLSFHGLPHLGTV
jgi:hypothetical protein